MGTGLTTCDYCGRLKIRPILPRGPAGKLACSMCWYGLDYQHRDGHIDYASDRVQMSYLENPENPNDLRKEMELLHSYLTAAPSKPHMLVRLYLWISFLFSGAKERLSYNLKPKGPDPYREAPEVEDIVIPTQLKVKKPGWGQKIKNWRSNMTWNYNIVDTFWGGIFGIIVIGLVSTGLYTLCGVIFGSGKVDYCYVEHINYKVKAADREKDKADAEGNLDKDWYRLKGHRSWRPDDRELAGYPDLADAVKAAEVLQCPIK